MVMLEALVLKEKNMTYFLGMRLVKTLEDLVHVCSMFQEDLTQMLLGMHTSKKQIVWKRMSARDLRGVD